MEKVSLKSWGILALLSLIWGSSFILIKKGLLAFSPLELASLRISIAAIALVPFFIKTYATIKKEHWKYLLVVGTAGSAIPAFLFAYAETMISSSMTSILNSLTPLWVLIIGLIFFAKQLSKMEAIGVLVGLFGTFYLLMLAGGTSLEVNLLYGGMVILATILYATSSNVVEAKLKGINSMTLSAAAFVMVGPLALSFLLLGTNFLNTLTTHPQGWLSFGYISILALMGTVFASIVFFKLLKNTNAVFASMIAYIIPIVGVGWGVLDGEFVSFSHLIGMALILIGVYLTKDH